MKANWQSFVGAIVLALLTSNVRAHDTWVQTNTNLFRTGLP